MKNIKRICKTCKKEFLVYPSQLKNSVCNFCSHICKGKDIEWKENIWKNRRTPIKTRHQVHRLVRKIFGNNLICQNCGKSQEIEPIHIHHKDKNILNNTLNNLISLCNSCHHKEHINKDMVFCLKCRRFRGYSNKNIHICPDKQERRHNAMIMLSKRERCRECGKLFGNNKEIHSCKHPRGMLGKHHTREAIQRIKESLKLRRQK